MSEVEQRHLKVVRENYVAFNNGDIDGVMRPMHPEIEVIVANEHGDVDLSQHHRGAADVRAFFEETKQVVGFSWVEIHELSPVEDGVVARVSIHGRIEASGAEGSIPAVHRYVFEGDEIIRVETFRPNWREELG